MSGKNDRAAGYGFTPRTNLLVEAPYGKHKDVINLLRGEAANQLMTILGIDDPAEREQRLYELSLAPGSYGPYGAVTAFWDFSPVDEDRRSALWTFCEPGEEEQAKRFLSGACEGLRFSHYHGYAMMRKKYDPAAARIGPLRLPRREVYISAHIPYGDWEDVEQALPRLGKPAMQVPGYVVSWRADGTFLPFPGSDPQSGEPKKFQTYACRVVDCYLERVDMQEAVRTIRRAADKYELPVVMVSDTNKPLLRLSNKVDGERMVRFG